MFKNDISNFREYNDTRTGCRILMGVTFIAKQQEG